MKLTKKASGLSVNMTKYEWLRIGMAGGWADNPDTEELLREAEELINATPLGRRKKYSLTSVKKLDELIDKVDRHASRKRGIRRMFYEQVADKLRDICDTIEYSQVAEEHPVIIEVQPEPTGDIVSPVEPTSCCMPSA